MKVTVNQTKSAAEVSYPCLMINTCNQIVLFRASGDGTLLYDLDCKERSDTGYHSKGWGMSGFKPYEGTLTVGN